MCSDLLSLNCYLITQKFKTVLNLLFRTKFVFFYRPEYFTCYLKLRSGISNSRSGTNIKYKSLDQEVDLK